MNALEDMINEESENKVKDTFHNAISIGEEEQDLVFVNKKLTWLSIWGWFKLLSIDFKVCLF